MRVRTFVITLALLAGAAAAHAQDGTLARVQNLIATGRLTEARNTLTQWERDNSSEASTASSDDRARALFLSGLLTTDVAAAEDAFIGVVLSFPSSPVAPEALLRLGQALYTAGENDRAITYLERLRSDYPGSPHRETGQLWLARAQLAAGDAPAACGTAREGLFRTTNDNVRTLIELERDRACAQSGGIATSATSNPAARSPRARNLSAFEPATPRNADTQPAPAATPARPTPRSADTPPPAVTPERPAMPLPDLGIAVDENVREPEPRPDARRHNRADNLRTDTSPIETRSALPAASPPPHAAAASTPRAADSVPVNTAEFAVQAAAFSELRPAETIATEMRARGLDVRIVQVPGSAYYRVRYGMFATNREAAAAALRVRDAGFATLIVNDVRLERRP